MDSRAAIAALLGVAIGTVLAVCAGERRWWGASAFCAFGTAVVLGIVTEGNHPRVEHNAIFAVQLVLLAYWMVVTIVGMRARRRDPR